MRTIKVPPVITTLAVLSLALAVAGCSTGSMNVSSTATPTPVPAVTPAATPTPAPVLTTTSTPTLAPTPTPVPTPTPYPWGTLTNNFHWSTGNGDGIDEGTVLLTVRGNVGNPMNLTVADLRNYPQVSIANHVYGAHHSFYEMTASGASLNALLDSARPGDGASVVTFYSDADKYSATVMLSSIRSDAQAMIAIRWHTNDTTSAAGDSTTLRNIEPADTYGTNWVFGLNRITVT
jgi:DMSO/TMAO reductase YedYZ molybdopterin-dependent catalytic subunit